MSSISGAMACGTPLAMLSAKAMVNFCPAERAGCRVNLGARVVEQAGRGGRISLGACCPLVSLAREELTGALVTTH